MITKYIEEIRTAIIGKDVKKAIADAIQTTYTDAINKGNTAAEVQIARGSYTTLGERINSIEENVEGIKTGIEELQDNIIFSTIEEADSVILEEGQIQIVYADQAEEEEE